MVARYYGLLSRESERGVEGQEVEPSDAMSFRLRDE